MCVSRCLLFGVVLSLSGACTWLGGSSHPLATSETVVITPARELPTNVTVTITTPFRWDVAKQGALEGMAGCANIQISGDIEALSVLLFCLPVQGVLGAVTGLLSNAPPPPVNIDGLEYFLAGGRPQTVMVAYTVQEARETGIDIVEPKAKTAAGADAVVEVWLRSMRVDVVARGAGANVRLSIDIRVRILDTVSMEQKQVFKVKLKSPVHSYQYWVRNDYAEVRAFVRDAAEEVVDQLEVGDTEVF